MMSSDPFVRALERGAWHPPMALRRYIDEFAYELRQQGLSYQKISERMGQTRERVRMRIARHKRRLMGQRTG